MQTLDGKAVRAASDREYMEQFIAENESFILQQVFFACGHPADKSSDEWSIGLIAFHKAVETYTPEKGTFLSYARLLIRNQMIDYFRVQNRHIGEIQTDPADFLEIRNPDPGPQERLRDEIAALNDQLDAYGFSFMELEKCSPKKGKTRKVCGTILNYMAESPELIERLQRTKQFPAKEIEKNLKVPRKIMERHRKYLIAAAEILSGDYPELAEYLETIRKEGM